MGSCGECLAKFGLITFNLIFLLSGIAVLGVGIWVKVDKNVVNMQDLVQIANDSKAFNTAGWVLIGFGLFVLLISALGFFAACKGNKIMLGGYIFFLVVICGGELAGGIAAAVLKGKIEGELKHLLNDTLHEHYTPGDNLGATAWDFVQVWLGCCGTNGPQDYREVNFTDPSQNVPATCCLLSNNDPKNAIPTDNAKCQQEASTYTPGGSSPTPKALQPDGCYDRFQSEIKSHLALIIGVEVGIAMLEILGIVLACYICLGKSSNSDYPA